MLRDEQVYFLSLELIPSLRPPPQANKGNTSICHTERGLKERKVAILAVLADSRAGGWSNNPTTGKNFCLSFTFSFRIPFLST
jgi:hypothetical protein